MKRILFTAAAIFSILYGNGQAPLDSSGFKSRKLKLDEINLVSSYYTQDGNNASVTGGIGSQKLTDIANVIDVKLTRYDKKLRKNNFGIEMGVDHYTSASSDKVDLSANSSASHADTRFYPTLSWSRENEQKGTTIGGALSSSTEYDYQSFGGNVSFSKKSNNKNGEFTAKFQTYLDQLKIILPVELRTYGNATQRNYPMSARNTYAASLSYSQIINERLQVMVLADAIQQNGYLSLPFHRVYFSDGSVHQENLPSSRIKIPLGLRANYFAGDRFIVKAYYRFYTDNWGIIAHTLDLEAPVKVTSFFSISPFYRFYSQTASNYFAAYKVHTESALYHTSNYDQSAFYSNFFGAGLRFAPPKGLFGNQHFSNLEVRYGHYVKNINFNANIISMNLTFK